MGFHQFVYKTAGQLLVLVMLLKSTGTIATVGFITSPATATSNANSAYTNINDVKGVACFVCNSNIWTHGTVTSTSTNTNTNNQFQMKLCMSSTSSSSSSRFGMVRKLFKSSNTNISATGSSTNNNDYDDVDVDVESSNSNAANVNDLRMSIPRIKSKPRPLVSLDETTGTYIPNTMMEQTLTSTSTSTVSSSTKKTSDKFFSGWNYVKDVVYDTVDSVTRIPKLIIRNSNNSYNNNRNLAVAYSDTVEFKSQSQMGGSSSSSPSILTAEKQFESSLLSLSSSRSDRSNGEDLYRSDVRKSFDDAKDGIYDLFAGPRSASAGNNKNGNGNGNGNGNQQNRVLPKKTPLQALTSSSTSSSSQSASSTFQSSSESDPTSFKSITKPSTNKSTTIQTITPYLPDLDSNNPLKVLKARYIISSIERKQKRRIQEQQTKERIDGVKKQVYNVFDAITVFYNMVLGLPQTIEESIIAVEEVLDSTKGMTVQTVKEVQSLPNKVSQVVKDAKRSVEDTKQATLTAVNDVKNIPQTIQKKANDTKQSIEDAKEGVTNFVKKVEDMTFEAKVVAGLEEPKPKPPPPPPPPKSNKEIALDVAGVVAKTTGKVAVDTAVVVGKGTIGLTTSAMKVAYNVAKEKAAAKGHEQVSEQQKKGQVNNGSLLSKFAKIVNFKKDQKTTTTTTATRTTVSVVDVPNESPVSLKSASTSTSTRLSTQPQPQTMNEIDPLLEKEVADALRSAEQALQSAKKEKKNPSSSLTTIEINKSLEEARQAAAAARRDAEELKAMLEKRREYFFKP